MKLLFVLRSTFLCLAVLAGSLVMAADGPGVTPPEKFSIAEGFEIDLVYEVPGEKQGSWVALTLDPKGRLIASDQYGGLYRIDLSSDVPSVQPIELEFDGESFGGCQGLLCAFGSLYATVNSRDLPSGIYRITDTNGDDQYDSVENLIECNGGGEHGPHALILSQDGTRILHVAGNSTNLPEMDRSRVPKIWAEDHLLGRMPDARGHNAKRMAPGGYIFSMDPDGKNTELIAVGFRNCYDIALDRRGELFTYDADMEWDVGTPWYRPTRINHVTSGAEFGWRNGTGKWPADYPDSLGSVVDIGPGSPTGVCFGYGAKFPAKYQNALFIADWSYGNLHAVHLTPDGSSYSGEYETFATAAPLPITDLVVNPNDGALYMTVGGRRTRSGVYRLRYVGDESTDPAPIDQNADADQSLAKRISLERFHLSSVEGGPTPTADDLQQAFVALGSSDREIRFAARTLIEHQGPSTVRDAVKAANSDDAKIQSVIALSRVGTSDQELALDTLGKIDWTSIDDRQQVDLLRAYALVAIRMGQPNDEQRESLIEQFSDRFPAQNDRVGHELAAWLAYLGDASATSRIVSAMTAAPSQESQIAYAFQLRGVTAGWDDASRREYLGWFQKISDATGGASFGGFLANIKDVVVNNLDAKQKERYAELLKERSPDEPTAETRQRPLVKQWTVDEIEQAINELDHKPNYERGKSVFAEAQCYKCHRMAMQGGIVGPDLTSAGGKYGQHDMLVHIVEPSKEISDQYSATQFLTDEGRLIVGRIINISGDNYRIMTDMLDPGKLTTLNVESIEFSKPSESSMMPSGLVDTYTPEEIADLLAYLKAGGKKNHPVYTNPVASTR